MCSQPLATIMQGVADMTMGNSNAKLAKLEGGMAWRQGVMEGNRIHDAGQRFLSTQTVADASGGVDTSSGSSAEVAAENAKQIQIDALDHVYAGRVKKWQSNIKATAYKTQGAFAFGNSLLTAGAQAAKGAAGGGAAGAFYG